MELNGEGLDARHGQTVEHTVQRLRDAIFAGRLVPGQRLIAGDLTAEIGISRGTVREAFRRLEADGLLEIIPNRGAVVRRLSRDQVRELFQIRENLESLAARLAAAHIGTGTNRDYFTGIWNTVRPSGEMLKTHLFMEHNRLFHRSIVKISGNTMLSDLIETLHLPVVMFQVGQVMQPENMESSHQDHVRVAQAILDGDADRAEQEMRLHLKRSGEWVLRLPSFAFKGDR
ncbi:GntR family transcriptional regulator [Xanthobacter sp. VTT E-85241]|uniref:GntR family transcriptional regulator n=1 Tax=Roseixanthobacter finlandensis TaxID=3119922 RepID=UPI00372AC2F7